MIEILDNIDKQWLLFLNNDYPAFWDGIMVGFSEKITWIPLYLSLLFVIFKKWKYQGLWIVVGLVLTVVVADQIASGVLKGAVQRLRPSHDPEMECLVELVNNYRSGRYGFVSSHAANSFGLALLAAMVFRNRVFSYGIFSWAIINAYSRIYLGVHYPGDILGGIIVGVVTALLFYWLLKKFRPQLFTTNLSGDSNANIPIYILGLSVLGLMIYSVWFFRLV